MKKIMFYGSLALLLAGCIPSVNPFYTEKDLVFDPQLVGNWQPKEEPSARYQFEQLKDKSYKMTLIEEKGKKGEFAAHLFKLGKEQFLDIVPLKCDYAETQADLVGFAMFPGHLLLRAPQIGPELQLAAFDYDWLKKYLDENPKALAHHEEEDGVVLGNTEERIVLTAGTKDLQRFVLAHLAEGQLFKPAGALVRVPEAGSAKETK